MNKSSPKDLQSSGLLLKNSLLNFGGKAVSILAALVGIPLIISFIGTDRFGILSIAWIILGYMGVLDLGVGRALTKYLSEQINNNSLKKSGHLIGSAIIISLGIGLILMVILIGLAPYVIKHILNVDTSLQAESIHAIQILAFSLFFNILAIDFRAILESFQKFKILSFVQSVSSSLAYLGLAAVAYFTTSLPILTLYLTFIKVGICLVLGYTVIQILKTNKISIEFNLNHVKTLFKYGSWITISNIISPLMEYIDRFFIGSFITMTAVTYYSTSFDMVQKLNVVPTSLVAVLFPALSVRSEQNKQKTNKLLKHSESLLQMIVLPVIVFLILFSDEILTFWLSKEFAQNSSLVLQILCAGAYFNNMAQIYFTNIQAANRPDLTAKIHFAEFPIFVSLMYYFTLYFGILGAAFTRMLRVITDQCLLFFVSANISDLPQKWIKYIILPLMGLTILLLWKYLYIPSFQLKVLVFLAMFGIYLYISKDKWISLAKRISVIK